MAPADTSLTRNGYCIRKAALTPQQYRHITTELMVRPYTPVELQTPVQYPVFRESETHLFVPRCYGYETIGAPERVYLPAGAAIDVPFHGALREYQRPAMDAFLAMLAAPESPRCGLLEVYCGWGKTIAALWLVHRLRRKTLIIVHMESLADQWLERIGAVLPSARVGRIQGDRMDLEDKDIVICMLQSAVRRKYPTGTFDSFGFTVVDECHHISSQSFSCALFEIVTPVMLGLSATMQRLDGTTHVFKKFLGEVVFRAQREISAAQPPLVRRVQFSRKNDFEYDQVLRNKRGEAMVPSMISKISRYAERTRCILFHLEQFYLRPGVDPAAYARHKERMLAAQPACETCGKRGAYLAAASCCGHVARCFACLHGDDAAAGAGGDGGDEGGGGGGGCVDTGGRGGGARGSKGERSSPYEDEHGFSRQKGRRCPFCGSRAMRATQSDRSADDADWIEPMAHRQTLVLSHNLSLLSALYVAICERNVASAGFYIGAMKREALVASAQKQIVLGTYAAASEGLDIPTLNAEFLVTPKTNIEQTVGRILRAPHPVHGPVIYDFVDQHDVFVRQAAKRLAYFKKHGYVVVTGRNDCTFPPTAAAAAAAAASPVGEEEQEEEDEQEDEEEEGGGTQETPGWVGATYSEPSHKLFFECARVT